MQILPLCYLHLVAASRSYRIVPKMVLTLQLALVVFFRPSTSANTPLALMVVIATCAGGVFPQSTSAFTNAYIATCTVLWYIILFTLHYHGKLQLALYIIRNICSVSVRSVSVCELV